MVLEISLKAMRKQVGGGGGSSKSSKKFSNINISKLSESLKYKTEVVF